MAKLFVSLILLAAYFLSMGQAGFAPGPGHSARIEYSHSHSHDHHDSHHHAEEEGGEAPGQEPHSHSHEFVVGGCACFVVPGPSARLFEAPASGTAPPVSEPSAPYAASTRSIFRPPIA